MLTTHIEFIDKYVNGQLIRGEEIAEEDVPRDFAMEREQDEVIEAIRLRTQRAMHLRWGEGNHEQDAAEWTRPYVVLGAAGRRARLHDEAT